MKRLFHWTALVLCLGACLVLTHCSGNEVAGGTSEETNSISLAGSIKDIKGSASGVIVTIYPEDFNPVADAVPDSMRAITDSDGRYLFKIADTGTYNIQALHPENRTTALVRGIEIPELKDSTITLPYVKLKEPAAVTIHISEMAVRQDGYLYVPGTGINAVITPENLAGCYVTLEVPSASYPVVNYNGPDELTGTNILTEPVDAKPGEIIAQGPYAAWSHSAKIAINTTSTGANVADDVYNFPLLVGLDFSILSPPWGEGGGKDLRFTKSDGLTILPYEIERWDPSAGQAEIWVKIDTICGDNNSQFIYIYTGKADASPLSSGPAVFDAANGFAGVWHLGEPGNTDADGYKDATGSQNHGTGVGLTGASDVQGAIGTGQEFDGSTQYITVPDHNSLDVTRLTLSAWIKADNLGGRVIDKITPGGQDGYDMDTYWGFLRLCANKCDSANTPLPVEEFVHIAITFDSSIPRYYVNGLPSGTSQMITNIPVNDLELRIGATNDPLKELFDGIIDEARVSNLARSDTWIALCYENQKSDQTLISFESE